MTTAAGRVFYGGDGIAPDIEVKPLQVTPLRSRIAEAAFFFTRELTAGQIQGLESYKIEKTDYDHNLKPTDYPMTDKVIAAFREFVQRDGNLGIIEPVVGGEYTQGKGRGIDRSNGHH